MDESGFCLTPHRHCTWAPKGQTPTIRLNLNRGKVNAISALIVSPHYRHLSIHAHLHFDTVSGAEVICFLTALLQQVPGEIALLWDNGPIHTDQTVQAFLAQHPRVHYYPFPSYAPDLNPAEFIWTQIHAALSSKLCSDIPELTKFLCTALRELKASQRRLRACISASALPWKL